MSRNKSFLSNVGGAIENVAKGVSHVVTNPIQTAEGVGKVVETVAENPGLIADVGKQIIKEELKPKNLLINAALLAATAATGGAAAPAAFAAKTAMAGRGIKTGATVLKAADKVGDVSRATKYVKKASEVGRAAEKMMEGGQDAGRLARGMERINDVRRKVSPVTNIMHKARTGIGEKILEGGTGPGRQALANLAQGTGGIGKTTRMVGQTDAAYRAQQQMRHVKMARTALHTARAAPEVASAVADPGGYAMKKAMQGAGDAKMGDTGDYQTAAGGQTVVQPKNESGIETSANGIVQPAGWKADMEPGALRGAQRLQNFGAGVAASNTLGGGNALWKGPTREGLGGIGADYDWRQYQQRNVNQVTRSSAFQGGQLGALSQPAAKEGDGEAEPAKGGRPSSVAPSMAGRPVKPQFGRETASQMYTGGSPLPKRTPGANAQSAGIPYLPGWTPEMHERHRNDAFYQGMLKRQTKDLVAQPGDETPPGVIGSKPSESVKAGNRYYGNLAAAPAAAAPAVTAPSVTTPGARITPAPGAGGASSATGRKGSFYTSGQTTEQGDITMGGTMAWNAKGQGSFAFPELTQPSTQQPKQATEVGTTKPVNKVSTRKSGIGSQGMSRIKAWQNEPDTTTPAPWMTPGIGNAPRVGDPNAVAPGAPATLPKRQKVGT